MTFVRTVLGDLDPDDLGPVDYHEHLFQVSPLLPGDDLDDENASRTEARALLLDGTFSAMVEATPIGLGRDPAGVARISRETGLHIVLTTGAHRSAHYPDSHPIRRLDESDLASAFLRDLMEGAGDDRGVLSGDGQPEPEEPAPRAGLLKAGVGYWAIDGFERRTLAAVAHAHRATGAPVMVHLEHGSAAHEVLDILESDGVAPDRVALAHMDRNPDPQLHVELAGRGAYLGYDGMARHRNWPDSMLVALFTEVATSGGGRRLLLGGDVARRTRYAAYGGMPGLAYLPRRFLPRLRAAAGDEPVRTALVDNPARWLAWRMT